MVKKSHINEQPSFEGNYEALGVDYLLIYCVRRVLENGEECTLERLVYECFTLFPKKFALSRYSQWPDSTRVYRSWRRCIDPNNWLKGTPQEGFHLTSKGKTIALEVAEKLRDPSLIINHQKAMSRTRGKEEAVVHYLRKSNAFRKWMENHGSFVISESELRSLLNATLETPREVLSDNLEYYFENAELVKDNNTIEFLHTCRNQHDKLFRGK